MTPTKRSNRVLIKKPAGIVKNVDIKKMFVEDDDVCVLYEIITNTPAGTAFVAEWFRVKGGLRHSTRTARKERWRVA